MSLTDIDKVRLIAQDVPVHQKDSIDVEAGQTRVQLTQFPVVDGTVIITPTAAFEVNLQTGLVTLDEAAEAGTLVFEYDHTLLSDDAIQTYLDLEALSDADGTADLRLAAADALNAMAASQAIILKKIRLLDLQTDGPAVADALRQQAKILRTQVAEGEPAFDIIEQAYEPFGTLEKYNNEIQKSL